MRINGNDPDALGFHYIYAGISSEVPNTAFKGKVAGVGTDEESKLMKFYLFRSGYIDTEGFLTSQFDPNMELWLDPE